MRKFLYILYILAIIPVILGLYGCTNKPKEISEEVLTTYLEKKYNDTFTLKDCKNFSPHKGTDTLYTFESGSGISCHVSKVYSGGFMGYTYSYQEDYPTMYLRKYPELIAELLDGDFEAERIDTESANDFLEDAQDTYVGLVREGKLLETLSAEVLTKHPAPAIRNITFHDETVIDCMVYRKEIREYVIDQSCIEYKGCPFYPDQLATPLRTLGWSVKLSNRSIIWSRGTD